MPPRAITARDAGLALISRINRWMIAGAVALTGVISVAAANAFHGRTVSHTSASAPATSSQPQSSAASSSSSSNGGGSGLQQPQQVPSSASASAATAPVTSGGS